MAQEGKTKHRTTLCSLSLLVIAMYMSLVFFLNPFPGQNLKTGYERWILLEINQFKLCSLPVNKYLLRVHILPQTEASL